MRYSITALVMMVGACLLFAGVTLADGTVQERQTATKLYRGSSIIAASDPNSAVYVPDFTPARCETMKEQRWRADALARTSGTATYKCQVEERAIIAFHPAPPTCGARPGPDEQRTQTCPAGTVGTWLQDSVWTLQPYPACWVQGDWLPAAPPAGMCAVPTNRPPTISGAPRTSIEAGRFYDTYFTAIDPEGARITYGVTGPSWLRIEPSGRLWGTAPTTAGVFAGIVVTASDGVNSASFPAFAITVSGSAPTPVNCVVSAWSAWTPAQCVAPAIQTHTRTIVTQPSNGGTACPALTESQTCPSVGTGTATLSWRAPALNTDGSALANLAGFRISHGASATELVHTIQVANPGVTEYVVTGLPSGTRHFAVRAYTSSGTESASSNVVSKSIP